MDSTAIFSGMRPLKLFFFASVPGAVSMLASALYQTIDGVLVGQFLGATAFAAINLAMPFVIINLICVQSSMERAEDVRKIVNIVRRQPAIRPKWKIIHCFPRKRFWKMQKR